MPPLFRSTSVTMKDETRDKRRDLLWAMPASLLFHALLIALLVNGLPRSPQQPEQEQAVNVALVPPPDQPKPKPAPVPPPEEAKAEKPPEPKAEQPPAPEKQPSKPASIEVLKPVFQFGDKDTGPRKSLDGGSTQDGSPSPAKDNAPKPPAPAQEAERPTTEAKDDAAAEGAEKQAMATPAMPAAPSGDSEIALPASVEAPQPRPTNVPKRNSAKVSTPGSGNATRPRSKDVAAATSQRYSGLPGVRRLYSQGATGNALAMTSMAGMPRGKRAATLCASELQQQLQGASYFPDLVPMVPLKAGNVLDVPETAFHAEAAWYGLSFRCEVDTDATKVLSFAFRVGTTIPSDEWARLGLPVRN
ncbi:DUF930 domain-containing protein [Mesorhizobium sp. A623]